MAPFNLGPAVEAITEAAERGLFLWGQRVLAESQNLVPIEEGTLQRSGQVAVGQNEVAVGYGSGAAAAYALIQHERMDLQHDPGRQAKYLEVPLVASQDYGPQMVAQAIQGVL